MGPSSPRSTPLPLFLELNVFNLSDVNCTHENELRVGFFGFFYVLVVVVVAVVVIVDCAVVVVAVVVFVAVVVVVVVVVVLFQLLLSVLSCFCY